MHYSICTNFPIEMLLNYTSGDENLEEKKVDSAGPEPATLGLPVELRAQLVRLSCRHFI